MLFQRRNRPGVDKAKRSFSLPGRLAIEIEPSLSAQLRLAALARGQTPEALAADLLTQGLEQEISRAQAEVVLNRLTLREQQVARRAALGCTNSQIAQLLVISPETVKSHIRHILAKLGLHSKTELRMLLYELSGSRSADPAGQAAFLPPDNSPK